MKILVSKMTVRAGLLLTYLALIALSTGLLVWRIGASLDASRMGETLRDQQGRAILVASVAEEFMETPEKISSGDLYTKTVLLALELGQPVTLWDMHGNILADSHRSLLVRQNLYPEIRTALQGNLAYDIRYEDDGEMLATAAPIRHEQDILGVAQIRLPMRAIYEARQQLWLRIVGASLLAILATIIVSVWFAGLLTRPLVQLTDAAAALANGHFDQRVEIDGPKELQSLAAAFNFMAGRISQVMQDQRTFIANAAHELRTPITAIRLRAEALRTDARDDPTTAERFLSEIESETERLARLTNELLDLSRIETGVVTPQRQPVSLGTLAHTAIQKLVIYAERKHIRIECDASDALPYVNADPDQMQRVLLNLLDNAIKFTPPGGQITIRVKPTYNLVINQVSEKGKWIVVSVQDNGVGIPPEDLPHIFQRFYRSHAHAPETRTDTSSGTGLGLAIVKSIIEAHAGRVWAESTPGKGSVISFALPMD